MNNYRVLIHEGVRLRHVDVQADGMDFHMGVLVFTRIGKGTVQAFREWVRVDRVV